MNRLIASLLLAGACTVSAQAMANGLTVARFEPNVVPVLVKVDKQGKVTSVFSSERLRPAMDRLLYRSARDVAVKQEGADRSRMLVLRMKLDARPRADGDFDARFVVLEAKPVPSAAWFWMRDGDRYALIDSTSLPRPLQHIERASPPMQDFHRAPPPAPAPQPSPGGQAKT
ncbi:MAG: hypothetical protein ABW178_06245 [Pseudoxanthomonas sp.]